MSIRISKKLSKSKKKIRYYFEWGKGPGQRVSSGVFTHKSPKDQIQKNHNKEALNILESKLSKMVLEKQSIASGYIPAHKMKANFLDYYAEYVRNNARYGSRHLASSFKHFKSFLKVDFISAGNISESVCLNYRKYLLDKYNGETPANYFREFKRGNEGR